MAKGTRHIDPPQRSEISFEAIPGAIRKLERRLKELEDPSQLAFNIESDSNDARIISNSINATMDEVFGTGTEDAKDFKVSAHWFSANRIGATNEEIRSAFKSGINQSSKIIQAAIARLNEWKIDAAEEPTSKVFRAYEGLDLHPEIARAASCLFLDGHYSNAVENAVKALNMLVKLRSGCDDRDGIKLMEFVFSPNNPVLRFNELRNQSDHDEQKGFMYMFAGAVAGLRNPRAHEIIQDDAERALEFIAFVSLLAKLLDSAEKT